MLKHQTYFEQVPVKLVLKIAQTEPKTKLPLRKEKLAGRPSARTTAKDRVSHE